MVNMMRSVQVFVTSKHCHLGITLTLFANRGNSTPFPFVGLGNNKSQNGFENCVMQCSKYFLTLQLCGRHSSKITSPYKRFYEI